MEIKFTVQGLLIYVTMAAYLVSFCMLIVRRRKGAEVLYFAGFVVAAAAFIYRWHNVRHVPLQNLFEVFLCLGMVIYPISAFCRRRLGVSSGADAYVGAMILFPAGFVFHARALHLPPALQSWLFTPHVAVYMLSYVIMAKAACQAGAQLVRGNAKPGDELVDYEQGTYRMVCIGFPLLTLGLILGSVWGKIAWGDYWGWDPKELWSLASWLVYIAYFHFRYMYGRRYSRANSVWALAGMAVIIITLLWVNLSKLFGGLHNYAT